MRQPLEKMAPGSREGRAEAENNRTEQGNVPVLHGIMDTKNETELRDISRTPLVVQWLRLHTPDARGLGSFLVRELDPTCCKEDPTKPKKLLFFFLKRDISKKALVSMESGCICGLGVGRRHQRILESCTA